MNIFHSVARDFHLENSKTKKKKRNKKRSDIHFQVAQIEWKRQRKTK